MLFAELGPGHVQTYLTMFRQRLRFKLGRASTKVGVKASIKVGLKVRVKVLIDEIDVRHAPVGSCCDALGAVMS